MYYLTWSRRPPPQKPIHRTWWASMSDPPTSLSSCCCTRHKKRSRTRSSYAHTHTHKHTHTHTHTHALDIHPINTRQTFRTLFDRSCTLVPIHTDVTATPRNNSLLTRPERALASVQVYRASRPSPHPAPPPPHLIMPKRHVPPLSSPSQTCCRVLASLGASYLVRFFRRKVLF